MDLGRQRVARSSWPRLWKSAAIAAALASSVLLGGDRARADDPVPASPSPWDTVGLAGWRRYDRANADPMARASYAFRIGRYAPRDAPALPRARDGVDYDADLANLTDNSPELSVRLAAIAALAERGTPAARTALLRVAGAGTVIAVRHLSGAGAPPPVSQPEVQAAALRGLRSFRLEARDWGALLGGSLQTALVPGEVLDAAADLLAAQDADVHAAVSHDSNSVAARQRLLVRSMVLRADPRAYPAFLHPRVFATSPIVSQEAAIAAVRLHASEAVSDLTELLRPGSTRDLETRRVFLRALGSLGGAPDPGVLLAAVADPPTRSAALDACGRAGDARCIPAIAPLLAASWVADRLDAAEALGAIGGDVAANAVLARLRDERDARVRTALWHALARAAGSSAAPVLARNASADPGARWALVELALRGTAGDAQVTGLGDAIARGEPSALALAGALGEHTDALTAALHATGRGARTAAALGLGFRGGVGADVEAALETALAREDAEGARVAMVLALARSAGPVAQQALRALVDRERDDPTPAAIVAALATADLGIENTAALVAMSRTPWPLARAAAARALGRAGRRDAAPALQWLVRFDTDSRVRGAAARSLAEVLGVDAIDDLESLERVAWTSALAVDARAAVAVAHGAVPVQRFAGSAVARVSGAPAGSVWGAFMPDGTLRVAVAAEDGELLVPGVPAGDGSAGGRPGEGAEIERLDAR